MAINKLTAVMTVVFLILVSASVLATLNHLFSRTGSRLMYTQ